MSGFLFRELSVCFEMVEGLIAIGGFGVLLGNVLQLGPGILMESEDTDLFMLFAGILEI